MAIDRITGKILADAEAEAKRIAVEADGKTGAVNDQTARQVADIEKEAAADAAAAARDQRERMLSRAQAEMRVELLEEKQALIEQVFENAMKTVLELDDKQYGALMERFLLEGVGSGDEEVIIAESDRKRNWTTILDSVNAELSKQGQTGRLTLSPESRTMGGGFVLRKGKQEVNCDLTFILKSLREELETDVVNILFPETKSTS